MLLSILKKHHFRLSSLKIPSTSCLIPPPAQVILPRGGPQGNAGMACRFGQVIGALAFPLMGIVFLRVVRACQKRLNHGGLVR